MKFFDSSLPSGTVQKNEHTHSSWREDAAREIESHYEDAKNDLLSAGNSESEAETIVRTRFGDEKSVWNEHSRVHRYDDYPNIIGLTIYAICAWLLISAIANQLSQTGTNYSLVQQTALFLLQSMVQIVLGIVGLFASPFCWLFVGIEYGLYRGIVAWLQDKKVARVVVALASIALWISLFLSYRIAPNAYLTNDFPIANGGFPFRVFGYPGTSMGGDVPPLQSWPVFYLNVIFWTILSFGFFPLLKRIPRAARTYILLTAMLTTLAGASYLLLQFD